MASRSRRALLQSLALGAVALGGCTGSDLPASTTTNSKRSTTRRTEITTAEVTETTAKTSETTDAQPQTAQCAERWNPHERWSVRTGVSAYPSTVGDGRVYFGSRDDHLYAVDIKTGTVEWRLPRKNPGETPPNHRNGLITFAGEKWIATYDADGRERWSFTPPGEIAVVTDSVAGDANSVYVGASQHSAPSFDVDEVYDRVYAFDRQTGTQRWQTELRPSSKEESTLIPLEVGAGGGCVVVATKEGVIIAFDAQNGSELWWRKVGRHVSTPIVDSGTVFQQAGHTLYALDARTGQVVWQASGEQSPTIGTNTVYCPEDGVLRAFDTRNGQQQWAAEIPDGGCGRHPIIAGDTVYLPVGCVGIGRLDAYDAASGCRRGRFTVESKLATTPAVADETVYVGGQHGEGRMWAISAF